MKTYVLKFNKNKFLGLLNDLNLTRYDFCHKNGIDYHFLGLALNNKVGINKEMAEKIVTVLKMPINNIFIKEEVKDYDGAQDLKIEIKELVNHLPNSSLEEARETLIDIKKHYEMLDESKNKVHKIDVIIDEIITPIIISKSEDSQIRSSDVSSNLTIDCEVKKIRTKIISAFPGTGKTYYHKLHSDTTLDSDSSLFSWLETPEGKERNPEFPQNYINHIKENIGKYEFIFVSSHKEVRDALLKNCLFFFLLYPTVDQKDEYIKRYIERGSPESFIELISQNWDRWIHDCRCENDGCFNRPLEKFEHMEEVLTNPDILYFGE